MGKTNFILDEFSMLGPINLDSIIKNARKFKIAIKETDINALIEEGKTFKEINEIYKALNKPESFLPKYAYLEFDQNK